MDTPVVVNLFEDAAPPGAGERFQRLLQCGNVVIERIVSSARPEPTEYVQAQDEWVALLSGSATLSMAGRKLELAKGDALFIPKGTPHRVERTSLGAIWLAVHIHPRGQPR